MDTSQKDSEAKQEIQKCKGNPETALLAEYQALRDESLRCAQIISTTLWVGISGFAVTVGAGLAALKAHPLVLPLAMSFLCLQALGASTMLLAEVWKYGRVGCYIRKNIEACLVQREIGSDGKRLLNWEHWINNKRPMWFYVLSLLILQAPVLVAAFVLASFHFKVRCVYSAMTSMHAQLGRDKEWICVLFFIVIAEFLITFVISLKVLLSYRRDFKPKERFRLSRWFLCLLRRVRSASHL